MTNATKRPGKQLASRPVESLIHIIRGQKVMLDRDLAALYEAEPRALIQAVKRNRQRFPSDFMFMLSHEEAASMRSQSVISSRRGIKYQPLAFTEHGVAMLSSVLRSERAVRVNIMVIRTFVRLREMIASNKDLAERIGKLEAHQRSVGSIIDMLVDEIEKMKSSPEAPKRKIGFDL